MCPRAGLLCTPPLPTLVPCSLQACPSHQATMKFEFDEDFDKRLLTGSGIALGAYAVAGAAAPTALHEFCMTRVGRMRLPPAPPLPAQAPLPYKSKLERRCALFTLLQFSRNLPAPADRAVPRAHHPL